MLSASIITKSLTKITNQQTLFGGLFQFIKKNKAIPKHLAAIKTQDPKVQNLLAAINLGNSQHEIYSDPKCYLYLLHLIQNELIPFYQGMGIYNYLLALMQFSDKQPLKPEDQDVKYFRPELPAVGVANIFNGQQLTLEGENYLKTVHSQLTSQWRDFSYDELVLFVKKLAPSEQWLIKIPVKIFPPDHYENPCDRMACTMKLNLPFIESEEENEIRILKIPSYSLINFFLKQVCKQPMEIQCCFGIPSDESSYAMHLENKHPVSYYAFDVKRNLYAADNWRCGPFIVWLHDIGHVFWASLLSKQQRDSVLLDYVPQLKQLKAEIQGYNDEEAVNEIQKFINKANEFDLTSITLFTSQRDKFLKYISGILGPRGIREGWGYFYPPDGSLRDNKVGTCVQDRIYFMLLKKMYEAEKISKKREGIWEILIRQIDGYNSEEQRRLDVTFCLCQLTATREYYPAPRGVIDWTAWENLLTLIDKQCVSADTETVKSQKLWEQIIASDQRHDEFLIIIESFGINFFHPYLPMTEELLINFKKLITNQKNAITQEEQVESKKRSRL
ncbi:MAG: hypothetical protein V4501_00895 [Pseudomonadota bacterium]